MLTLFFLIFSVALAADLKRIAVLEFSSIGMNEDDQDILLLYPEAIRSGIIKELDSKEFNVLTRENIDLVLADNDQESSCIGGSCEVELARNIGADYVFSGSAQRHKDGTFFISLKLHNTDSAALMASEQISGSSPVQLNSRLKDLSRQMLRDAELIQPDPMDNKEKMNFIKLFFHNLSHTMVSVNTQPKGAHLYDGNTLLCRATPCSVELQKGRSYNIRASKDEYFDKEQVVVGKKKISNFIKLDPNYGYLHVDGEGPFDSIKINGEEHALPVDKLKLPRGSHTITKKSRCFKPYSKVVRIDSAEVQTVTVKPLIKYKKVPFRFYGADENQDIAFFVGQKKLKQKGDKVYVPVCAKKVKVKVNETTLKINSNELLHLDEGRLFVLSKVTIPKVRVANKVFSLPIDGEIFEEGRYSIGHQSKCYERKKRKFEVEDGEAVFMQYQPSPKMKRIYVKPKDNFGNSIKVVVTADGKEIGSAPGSVNAPTCTSVLEFIHDSDSGRAKQTVEVVPEDYASLGMSLLKASYSPKLSVPLEGRVFQTALINSGSYTMGSPYNEEERDAEERTHDVTLSTNFRMMTTEVTQSLYKKIIGKNPSERRYKGMTLTGDQKPVTRVCWSDAAKFANKLSEKEGYETCYRIKGSTVKWDDKECEGWRLPTEAEWEYAAATTPNVKEHQLFSGTDSYTKLCQYANIADLDTIEEFGWPELEHHDCRDGEIGLAETGLFRANDYGVYDLTGNVWEWVWDAYKPYSQRDTMDPAVDKGSKRVVRGGGWTSDPEKTRNARRLSQSRTTRNKNIGIRLVRTVFNE